MCWCCCSVGHSSAQPAILAHVNPNHCGSAPCPRAPELCTSFSSLIDSNRLLVPQHHHLTRVVGAPRCFLFCCWPCSAAGSGRACPVSAHARTTPIVSCARRSLGGMQLSGSLPSSLGSLTGLAQLYVGVLSVSVEPRHHLRTSFCCGTVLLCFSSAGRAPLPVRCVSAPSLLTHGATPIFRARAGTFRATSCRARCRARSGR